MSDTISSDQTAQLNLLAAPINAHVRKGGYVGFHVYVADGSANFEFYDLKAAASEKRDSICLSVAIETLTPENIEGIAKSLWGMTDFMRYFSIQDAGKLINDTFEGAPNLRIMK